MSRLQQRLMEARQSILEQIVIRQSKRSAAPRRRRPLPKRRKSPGRRPSSRRRRRSRSPPSKRSFLLSVRKKGTTGFPLSLLADPSGAAKRMTEEEWVAQSRILERKLLDFDVEGKVTQVHPGPVVTMFEFEPAPGIKLNRITNLADDLALAMKAMQVRIVAPLPGKSTVGIEIPNVVREEVLLKEILSSPSYNQIGSKLRLALGKDIFGNPVSADLATMPHLLIAGSTGSGKSVGLNGMILSLLYSATPSEVKMLMIDPKMLEFSRLRRHPPSGRAGDRSGQGGVRCASQLMVAEMQRRYQLLAEKGVRNIDAYNKLLKNSPPPPPKTEEAVPGGKPPLEHGPLPYIVILIDELADLMMVAPRDDGRVDYPPGAEGPRRRHPPDPGHAAPLRRCDHRPDQGQLPDAHRLLCFVKNRLQNHP
ncbi:MAG: DNA translocase FtsK [Candidatus Manganitrophus sp.]|nr:MAG: DNA translocase FtsK [Candidatus Manganitrophus sp.]